MQELEIQKLTAAIEKLTSVIEAANKIAPTAQKAATAKKAEAEAEPKPKPEPEPSPPADAVHVDAVSSVSKDNLKEIALEITQNDPAAKKEILAILASHKSKTITDLPMDQDVLFDVFTRLNNIVHRIAREAEQ